MGPLSPREINRYTARLDLPDVIINPDDLVGPQIIIPKDVAKSFGNVLRIYSDVFQVARSLQEVAGVLEVAEPGFQDVKLMVEPLDDAELKLEELLSIGQLLDNVNKTRGICFEPHCVEEVRGTFRTIDSAHDTISRVIRTIVSLPDNGDQFATVAIQAEVETAYRAVWQVAIDLARILKTQVELAKSRQDNGPAGIRSEERWG